MALAMSLHPRLGAQSPASVLTPDALRLILDWLIERWSPVPLCQLPVTLSRTEATAYLLQCAKSTPSLLRRGSNKDATVDSVRRVLGDSPGSQLRSWRVPRLLFQTLPIW
eukprot:CAMPEP_0119316310 /NCGR_PEP_ID=MMETSP1333-20130426/39396_1 /TAXON_ID=418940 /ORGANISM="Scyphosphaera apsteinii, Strain RCC1455" /LENGTH=109 /DNA_ID=CAMNT_0007321925 /DNA_START=129 /DNA_END=455 /DNA_ORIENTATION=+